MLRRAAGGRSVRDVLQKHQRGKAASAADAVRDNGGGRAHAGVPRVLTAERALEFRKVLILVR